MRSWTLPTLMLVGGFTLVVCARTPPVSTPPLDRRAVARRAISDQLAKIPPCSPEALAAASPRVTPSKLSLIRGHLEIREGEGCEPESGRCHGPWMFVPANPGQETFILSRRAAAEDFLWEAPESAIGDLQANTSLLEVVVNGRPDRRPAAARELWFESICAVQPVAQ